MHKISYIFILAAVLICSIQPAFSQNQASLEMTDQPDPAYDFWELFTAHNSVKKLVETANGSIYALTTGGFYEYTPGGETKIYNKADGKYDIEATDIAYDSESGSIWLSYSDGTISQFDMGLSSFQHFDDIRRNDRFVSNRINAIQLVGNVLYIATDFGLVQFNADRYFIIDTYTTFGRLSTASPVRSLWVSDASIVLGTDFGLVRGSRTSDLKVPDNWEVFDNENGFVNRTVNVVASSGNRIFATSEGVNFYFDGQNWATESIFPSSIREIRRTSDSEWIVSTSQQIFRLNPVNRDVQTVYNLNDGNQINSSIVSGNSVWVGTATSGLGLGQTSGSQLEYYVPDGPRLNLFENIHVTERGELLVGTSPAPGQFDIGVYDTGFSILKADDTWEHFFRDSNPFIGDGNLNSFFNVSSYGDDYFVGTWGYGITRLDRESGEIELYNNQTAGIPGITPAPDFYVATGLSPDRENRRYFWAVSWSNTQNPLARFDRETFEWEVYDIIPQVGVGSLYREVFVDTYGQKWISLMTNTMSGRGLLVAENPEGGSGEFVRLTSNLEFGGLPNEKVNAIIQDRRGEIWVGTDRGIGRFLFPERVINGTALERRAQPLINEDTTAFDRVLLRDVRVTSMVVDGNNQKWIGSDGDGIYLIEESGRRVIRQFTMSNSPLPSNTIRDLALNSETGELYIATANSLVRYKTLEREGVSSMDELRVFPNPYSYRNNSGDRIVIENLSDDATVHILTVDGRLVKRFMTRGGRVDWDGLDESGQRVSTGVYFIVATGNNNDQVGRGKVVIVR
jgi:ligand-binding sensor domain-containing protein